MCGIVGSLGHQNTKDVLIKGLQILEYRGYDSAGVSILDQGTFKRVRAEGKLVHLKNKLEHESFDGQIGIAHTRWATHGPPSERNAHPHYFNGVSIVHNGIIENYTSLREELLTAGHIIHSDTDTEVVAHLVANEVEKGMCLLDAAVKVLPRLEGAFSILLVSQQEPDHMVAFKNGPPLIIGQGEGSVVVASDVQVLLPYTKSVYYLNDFEIAFLDKNSVQFFNEKKEALEKKYVVVNWTAEKAHKMGFDHFMLKEIFEQPQAVAQAIAPHVDLKNHQVCLNKLGFSAENFEAYSELDEKQDYAETLKLLSSVKRVHIVACGTSFYAGLAGRYLIEKFAKIPVEVEVASEFRYREPLVEKDSLVIVISQSGETADTLAALRLANKMGAKTLCFCNVPRSTIDRESHGRIYMNSGVEVAVASTKVFTCTLSLLILFSVELAKAKGLCTLEEEQEIVRSVLSIPSLMESVLVHDKYFAASSKKLSNYKGFLYMGRGISFPIALEGALKLKELAYMHAEGYAAGEMKHGPLALIEESMAIVVIAPSDELYEKTISNLEEVKARGGQIISLGSGDNKALEDLSVEYLSIPKAPWYINPILGVIPLQLMSYHVAKAKGYDIDQPRNLAKSVTVE